MPKNPILYVLATVLVVVIIWLIRTQIYEHHLQDDPMLRLLKIQLEPLDPIVSNLRLYKGDKSYTINKQRVFLCVYNKNGEYYPINMLIYVLIHEIAHILNDKDIGHTEAFYEKFDELLQRAIELKIYNPSIPIIQNYSEH
jgi:hypothetical protein